MPFCLRRRTAANRRVKEYQTHIIGEPYIPDPHNSYAEVVKYKTIERAQEAAREWGGDSVEILEIPWAIGDMDYWGSEEKYPNF